MRVGAGYHMFNGHYVIEKYPVNRLFKVRERTVVRISLYDKRMPGNEASVYVAKRCCRKKGGEDYKGTSVYNIMLIDDRYLLYYTQFDKHTNSQYFVRSGVYVSPEELCALAEKTAQREARQRHKGHVKDTIDYKYCSKLKYASEETLQGFIENTVNKMGGSP